jgi:putative serine protease PepD
MSTNDRDPLRSPGPDDETSTRPLPTGGAAPGRPADDATAPGDRPPGDAADPTWPYSWSQSQPPTPDEPPAGSPPSGHGSGQPPAWGQAPSEPPPSGAGWGQQPPEQPGSGQGGGAPTVPVWGERPPGAGSPGGRRMPRALAGAVAVVVLLAGGYGIGQVLDRNAANAAPGGAGVPTAAVSAPIKAGDEPVAAVAKALLPTVVQLEVQSQQSEGLGSGVIYDKRGYILTAAHVVDNVERVTVALSDGNRLPGRVLGVDTANDVGVVKVDRDNLPAAPLAIDVPLQVGQLAVAIGSPFRLEGTVTAGVVSATNRILDDIRGRPAREVIQTDAPINPGNSGGVLADREGRVIGINSAIRSDGTSEGNIGIGFAVPIDLAARSATAIVQGKPIKTAYLGVGLGDPTTGRGALIPEVASGGPAARAGIRVGDVVVEMDGQAVSDADALVARIRDHQPGDKVTLKVVRDGRERSVTVTLGERTAG